MTPTQPMPIGSSSGLAQTLEASIGHRPAAMWRATVAGLSTSLLLHGSILVLGIVLLREVPKLISPVQDQGVVPTNTIESDDNRPSLKNMYDSAQGPSNDIRVATVGQLDGEMEQKMRTEQWQQTLQADLTPASTIGQGSQTMAGIKSIGTGTDKPGTQLGQIDGKNRRKIDFIGNGGSTGGPVASRVVFLCDATGTMTGLKFDLLKRELNTTISKLDPVQDFNVVFFADSGAQAIHTALLPGTPKNKTLARNFLDKFSPRGATNPIPGIEKAFAMKPEIIYLLSDGEFDNLIAYEEVIGKVKALNGKRATRVYTILFGDRDPRAEQTLKTIADNNGGMFRYVATDDLLKK